MVSGGDTDRSLICTGVKKIHGQEWFELSFVSRTAGEKEKTSIHHQYFWGTTSSITSRASRRVIFWWRGRFRVYWGFCPDNPLEGELDGEGTSLPGHLTCLCWPLNPGLHGIWTQRSQPLALLSDLLNVWRPLVKKWNSLSLRRATYRPFSSR